MPQRSSTRNVPHWVPRTARLLGQAPFVGNESVDDNVAEAVQIALWKELGPARDTVQVRFSHGEAILTGSVPSADERLAAERAVRALECISVVTNDIEVAAQATEPDHAEATTRKHAGDPSDQMIFVTRYCSLEEPSMIAAIKDGIKALSTFLTSQRLGAPKEVLLFYHNQRSHTISIDIACSGMLSGRRFPEEEIRTRIMPKEKLISATPSEGLDGMLATSDQLRAKAGYADSHAIPIYWQRIPLEPDPFSSGWPAAPIYMPVEKKR